MRRFVCLLAFLLVACGKEPPQPVETTPPVILPDDMATPLPDMSDAVVDMEQGPDDMFSPQEDMPPEDMRQTRDMPDAGGEVDMGMVSPPDNLILDPGHRHDTAAQLAEFYATYGARETFPREDVDAFEALLFAEDDLIANNRAAAIERVDAIFAKRPQGDAGWPFGGTAGSNVGSPVGYYGMRMIEHIDEIPATPGLEPLIMTGVVATCTDARIPQPEGATPTMERLTLRPEILADDARRLFLATGLFRKWIEAITGGRRLDLRIYVLEDCTTTDFTQQPDFISSYADSADMVSKVPSSIADETDIWWIVAPSGIRHTESELGRHPITGGMGLSPDGRPLILSDDLWFTKKPEHMGTGDWLEAEVRAYHPQWFQHEFMHHLYRTWPEFALEESGHQWFDRSTWPADFVGRFEPDYYYESINTRFLTATPSLAEGLDAPDFVGANQFSPDEIAGRYERTPVQNDWHRVTITESEGALTWTNAANVSWSLNIDGDILESGPDCPYGVQELSIEAARGQIESIVFGGEFYVRID
ncbi:MAG: hypothetical protein VX475_12940 [Myxococcota bacterium]|nr:hypothetical protein [Myxococcota bacterium]